MWTTSTVQILERLSLTFEDFLFTATICGSFSNPLSSVFYLYIIRCPKFGNTYTYTRGSGKRPDIVPVFRLHSTTEQSRFEGTSPVCYRFEANVASFSKVDKFILNRWAYIIGIESMSAKSMYQPPFTITPEILNRVAAISEAIGRLSAFSDQPKALRLRRINRVRTIHGSLAIEGNTLSEAQITAILDGKRVIASPREVREVKNALAAYDHFEKWHPEMEKDMLMAHRLLMSGLIDEAGRYRQGGVGVMAGKQVVHMAPPAKRVPRLMAGLFDWLSATDAHPLVASSVFHYEFEFIHPFADGNGRMGRLWQNLILARWNPLFANIPVESLIFEHQAEYYQALQESTRQTDSAPFIAFMLQMILDTITASAPQVTPHVTPQVSELLATISGEMSREALQAALGLLDRKSFRERYLKPALVAGLIEMTIPDKPNSRLQKYRLTDKGRLI